MLDALDANWIRHLETLDVLKEASNLTLYFAKNAKMEYVKRASEAFATFTSSTYEEFVERLFNAPLPNEMQAAVERRTVNSAVAELLK